MRALTFTLLLLAGLGTADAQARLTSLTGALTLRATRHSQTSTSCSMSYGYGASDIAELLRVRADGTAELEVTASSRSHTGPSVGRYGSGDHETSELGHALHAVYRGTARATASSLVIDFVSGDVEEAYWAGPGTLPLGPRTTRPFTETLRCTLERRTVLPAVERSGEVGISLNAATCSWDPDVPTDLVPYGRNLLSFGPGAGIAEQYRDEELYPEGSTLRFAAE